MGDVVFIELKIENIFKYFLFQVRVFQLKEEMEKFRVLQEALYVLVTEYYELEQLIVVRKSFTQRYYDTDEDEFYDCDEENLENIEGLYMRLLFYYKILYYYVLF